jgi:hypothetical protein
MRRVISFTTLGGTYYRWEVAPGTHRVAGFGAEAAVGPAACNGALVKNPAAAGFFIASADRAQPDPPARSSGDKLSPVTGV